ncbi:MAG: TIGR02206 family membrane protein [bacterium]|nr:TIGR02206 family membrane protein [bacterium]
MNSLFNTSMRFESYSTEHFVVLTVFLATFILFLRWMKLRTEEAQRKMLLLISITLASMQLAKIPLNVYTNTFDVTKDIPLHMCNFLPFVMIWIYATKSRVIWATTFFWVILGVSQANFTPSVQYSLFHYDAIRYWSVHLGLVVLALYPAIGWKWTLEFKDVARTLIAINGVAIVIYGFNLLLGSNYLYIMGKPPGTTFFSILPPWPTYILVLEGIIVVWSMLLVVLFKGLNRWNGRINSKRQVPLSQ